MTVVRKFSTLAKLQCDSSWYLVDFECDEYINLRQNCRMFSMIIDEEIYIYINVCICIYMYIYVCNIYIYIYIYIYIWAFDDANICPACCLAILRLCYHIILSRKYLLFDFSELLHLSINRIANLDSKVVHRVCLSSSSFSKQ